MGPSLRRLALALERTQSSHLTMAVTKQRPLRALGKSPDGGVDFGAHQDCQAVK